MYPVTPKNHPHNTPYTDYIKAPKDMHFPWWTRLYLHLRTRERNGTLIFIRHWWIQTVPVSGQENPTLSTSAMIITVSISDKGLRVFAPLKQEHLLANNIDPRGKPLPNSLFAIAQFLSLDPAPETQQRRNRLIALLLKKLTA